MREADVSVDDAGLDEMGLAELVALGREAGIRDVEELVCRGTGAIVRVEVADRYDETGLSELQCVNRWEHLTETSRGHAYVVDFTAPALPDDLAESVGDLLGTCDPRLDEREATLSFVGEQASIAEAVAAFEEAGVRTDLRKLESYEGEPRALDALTGRQREVLRVAYGQGYYEVPRETSTEAVAAELDVDPSTVAEHLQRAERNLVRRVLDE